MENNELNTTIAEATSIRELSKAIEPRLESTDAESSACVEPIKTLLGKQFWIPSYQRGYRWNANNVTALLEDIWEFIGNKKKKENPDEFYCLQPLVVKIREDSRYTVIDGQQRLTTILLILKYLEITSEDGGIKDYEITYDTRTDSKKFLGNFPITTKTAGDIERDKFINIDFWHIYKAYQAIKTWFEDSKNKLKSTETLEPAEKLELIRSVFAKSLLDDVKVIWYPVLEGENEIDVFTRLNIGKIRLTDAELIKSLFLNSSNYKALDSGAIRLKQLEIASEWDRIEYTLQQPDFWAFISNNPKYYSTRIEYIFDLISGNIGNSKKDLGTFAYYQAKFKEKKVDLLFIDKQWKEIKRYFQAFEDWFENELYYHKVGYLVNIGIDIKEIKKLWNKYDKVEFEKQLNDLITGCLGKIKLEGIAYGNNNIVNILLLFNIETIIQSKNSGYRFPFAKYQNEKWQIEHIDSNTTNLIRGKDEQDKWLEIAKKHFNLEDELKGKVEAYKEMKSAKQEEFDELREQIAMIENGGVKVDEEDKQGIGNLCLLDANTNQSYGNDLFVEKRRIITEKIKSGKFIPLCTQNVFLKLYTKDTVSLLKWGNKDKENYFNKIAEILYKYTSQEELTL